MSWPKKLITLCFYLLVITVPLFFLKITSELFEFNKIITVYVLTTIISTAWISECIIQKRAIFRRTLLDLPLLLFLLSQLVSFFFSIDRHISWFGYYSRFNGGLLSLFCYSILYWSFVTFVDSKSTKKLIDWTLITAVFVAIWGVAQHFGIDAKVWVQDVKNRVFSTLGQPNWLAAYLIALIFIPISKLLNTKKNAWYFWGITILLFVVIIFTKSRSGLLAFAISYITYIFLVFVNNTKDTSKNKIALASFTNFKPLFFSPFALLTVFFLSSVLIIKNPIRDLVLSKFYQQPTTNNLQPTGPALETGGTESGEIRKIVWRGAIMAWRDGTKNILIGSGPETFAMTYYAHRPVEHNNTSEWELLYNKAHNEFLNYLATTGVVGLISYLILLGFMAFQILQNIKHSTLNVALFAGWVSLSITNFWGFSVVPTQILLFLLPAIALSSTNNQQPTVSNSRNSKSQYLLLLIPFALSLWILSNIGRYFLADLHFAAAQKAYQAFNVREESSDILNSYNEYVQAYKLNPDEPAIASDFGIIAAYMSILSSEANASESANLANLAKTVVDQAISISPNHPNYYKTKSRMLLVLAAVDPKYLALADNALAQAAKLSPTDPRIPYNRSLVAKYAGNKEAQLKFLKEAATLRPAFNSALETFSAPLVSTPSSRLSP